jgi:protein-L-isoaspartate(D-aspartate) O-methyltransferase
MNHRPRTWILAASAAIVAATLSFIPAESAVAQTRAQFDLARKKMVEEAVIDAGVKNRRVIDAMLITPRHEFVEARLRTKAYLDMSLPIGDQQTISSPFIVAYMTESIDPQPADKVLEIGTGSGYQAAVLSPLVKEVYTIEIVEPLGQRAERALKRLNYGNVFTKIGDGFLGWPEHAPFDKIIVTCSPEKVPLPLIQQLKEGGLMVIPVGERYQQTLYLLRKKDGKLESETLRPTLFVPMTGAAEDARQVKPDPLNPQVINGGFEETAQGKQFVPGWYYERQVTLTMDNLAPEGKHYVTFRNREESQPSHLMQGFPIDGRKISEVELSAMVKHDSVVPGRERDEVPLVAISFYDENRADMGTVWLGPFRGSAQWHQVSQRLRVPPQAREGILRIGLFGATGEISFDAVRMKAVAR